MSYNACGVMEEKPNEVHYGLEGVYFTDSKISKVDGINGRLYYRGYAIEDIAKYSSFEETCYLLLYGKLPKKEELDSFSKAMAAERDLPDFILDMISKLSGREKQMHILSATISALSAFDSETENQSPEANMRKSIRLISKLSSIVAAMGSAALGNGYTKPSPELGHAENLLYMLTGKKPDTSKARMLDKMLMLHAEHSSNASTFACLVSASTLSDMYLSVVAGISALKGPLHGGADENALAMLHEIGNPDNTEEYIEQALAGKKKIMGFGHRVYKTYDPRARIIKESLMEIMNGSNEDVKNVTAIALRAEQLMIGKLGKTHGIWPNVDFFSGPVYEYLGIPSGLFTPLFAASRIPGWCAHIMEYWQNNKLLRPLENYTGGIGLKFVKMEDR